MFNLFEHRHSRKRSQKARREKQVHDTIFSLAPVEFDLVLEVDFILLPAKVKSMTDIEIVKTSIKGAQMFTNKLTLR